MKAAPTLNHLRFAPCLKGFRLLITSPEKAGRVAAAGGRFVSPLALNDCDIFRLTRMNKMNLDAAKFAEGKFRCQSQPTSKKGRHQRQINE